MYEEDYNVGNNQENVIELGNSGFIGGYAELFETVDGKPIDVGYFVTLDGRKVKIAGSNARYILGITTESPAVLGNNGDIRWKNKYVTDEWGKIIYENVRVPSQLDNEGNQIVAEHIEKRPIVNPNWDKDKQYIPRSLRPEWVSVGLLGQMLVRDDGSCTVNGYCVPNENGVATSAARGYRVLERTGSNQVLIMLRSTTFNIQSTKRE
ncbi:hypothetical protein IAI10_05830 [Clostridium sp. 19966]|uniref:peptidase G2 autoproteolytic cleavage domain-containing protein n=1 Tax=Clostridium sp. 19966 TaxID=2768166 RepID=UPI0028DF1E04|nr:peptidase G2 autoproteolytic cleavage domain-containing protein [Clostridium sp. 19966]MDT8716168.1 hypothetical protein [Clostridium sp. 19966]